MSEKMSYSKKIDEYLSHPVFNQLSEFLDKNDSTYSKKGVYIGEIIFTKNPEKYTVLGVGSCVITYFFDNRYSKFAIAHCFVPADGKIESNSVFSKRHGYYADRAIFEIINHYKQQNIPLSQISVKLVGGSAINCDLFDIGSRNVAQIKQELFRYNINIAAEDLSGKSTRSILEFKKNGMLMIRKEGEKYAI